MKVLIAEDDPISQCLLQAALTEWGYEIVVATNGVEAWHALQGQDSPRLVLLDWIMPGMDGLEVCRKVRKKLTLEPPYVIFLTGRNARADIVAGLQAGANDYVTKPFDREELQARLLVGRRVVELQQSLAVRVLALEEALAKAKQQGLLLPICSYCKKVQNDQNHWHSLEAYMAEHADVHFSHTICPECWEKEVIPQFWKMGLPPPERPVE